MIMVIAYKTHVKLIWNCYEIVGLQGFCVMLEKIKQID